MDSQPNRIVNPDPRPEDRLDQALRPRALADLIGQERIKENLAILIAAARQRGEPVDHVLFYGPPGLGKCITADSLILTSHGLVPFSTLIPVGMENETSQQVEVAIYGLNGLEPTSHIYASGFVPTLRVVTRSGFQLEGTPQHPVLVATPSGPQWKHLEMLSSEDYVAIARGTDVWGETKIVEWQSDSNIERRTFTETTILDLHATLTLMLSRPPAITELRHAYAGQISDNPTPEITAKRLGLPLSDGRRVRVIPEAWKITKPVSRPSSKIELDEDLAYFLGVLVGDGHFEQGQNFPAFLITSGESEMQAEIQRIICKVFRQASEVRQYGTRTARMRFSQSIGKVMLALGTKAVNASKKEVPAAILSSPRKVVVGFLQGLFDADGHAWKDGYIEFGTRSEALSRQVQLLLANLGIIGHRSEKQVKNKGFWNLFIGGENAARFHTLVGFRLERKADRKDGLDKRQRGWSRSELVPFANVNLGKLLDKTRPHQRAVHKAFDHVKRDDRIPTREKVLCYLHQLPVSIRDMPEFATLARLMEPTIYWDRVANITESAAPTFDFVVPGSHSFIANGFYNHNTTLAHILANEMGVNIKVTSGPAIERPGDLAAILTNLRAGDVLFVDEVHRLGRVVEEVLYPAMEDYALDIMIGKGPSARSIRLKLPRFTVIGATTRLALVTAPLRARFGAVYRLDYYELEAMRSIVERAAGVLTVEIEPGGVEEIARRGRGTPRVALRLLRRVRDYAQVRGDGIITRDISEQALDLLNVDVLGLDEMDRKVLQTVIEKYNGGPVGLNTIAASISEESDTIMDVVEPYLLQLGFLERTSQGRTATRQAYEHLDIPIPAEGQQRLF